MKHWKDFHSGILLSISAQSYRLVARTAVSLQEHAPFTVASYQRPGLHTSDQS